MKIYAILIFLFLNLNITLAQEVEVQEETSEFSEPIVEKEGNVVVSRSEILSIKEKIQEMDSKIFELSSKIKYLEKNLNSLPQIDNSSAKIIPTQKNYEAEKKDYDLALLAFKDEDYKVAEQRFIKFIEDHQNSSLLSNIYFWYGELYYRQKDFEKAGIYFLNGYRKFPRGIKAADSLLRLALSLSALDKGKESCKILNKLQREFKERSLSSLQKEKEILEKYNCQN